MSSPSAAANPLPHFPVVGGLVALLDKFLLDLGFSTWWAESVEFVVLATLLFVVLRAVIGRSRWLSDKLVEPAGLLVGAIAAALLVPEWLAMKVIGRFGRAPGRIVYGYGYGVLVLADGLRVAVVALLRLLGNAGKVRRSIACLLLVLGFLSWNNGFCAGDGKPCLSPVQQWVQLA